MIVLHCKTQRANGGGWEVVTTRYCEFYNLPEGSVLARGDDWLLFRHPIYVTDREITFSTREEARRTLAQWARNCKTKVVGGFH